MEICTKKCKVWKVKETSSQKCRISLPVIGELEGLHPSSYAVIAVDDLDVICQVWPSTKLGEKEMEVDCLVSRSVDDRGPGNCVITPVNKVATAEKIMVSLVVTKMEDMKMYKNMVAHDMYRVEKVVYSLLYKLCLASKFVINKHFSTLGKLHGISFIIIDDVHFIQGDKAHYGFIDGSTQISVYDVLSREHYLQNQELTHNICVAGLDSTAKELIDFVNVSFSDKAKLNAIKNNIKFPKGVLLRGPPGTGKTSLVKYISVKCNAYLLSINGPEVFGSRPGEMEENVTKIFRKAFQMSEEGPCILFIDEIDSVCSKRWRSEELNDNRSVNVILSFLDQAHGYQKLVVIGATNRPSALDPSLRRPGRLDKEIMINVPTCAQREEILAAHCQGLNTEQNLDLHAIATLTNGYVGADLMSVCHEAAYNAMKRSHTGDKAIRTADFVEAVKRVMPSTQKGSQCTTEFDPIQWSDIGGLEDVKLQIQQAVEWPIKHPEAFQRMGLHCPHGVLLYGPPGCCKTTLVRAAATSANVTFQSMSGAQLFSPFVGDSEKLIAEVFGRARAGAPSIVFFDEIDSIIGKRAEGTKQKGVQERVLSALLNEMDGIGIRLDDKMDSSTTNDEEKLQGPIESKSVLVVAATNRPDMLDAALTRPGRFDRCIYVPPPDTTGRLEILKTCTKSMPLQNVDLQRMAELTINYSGADLKNLCREAALYALTRNMNSEVITEEDVNAAVALVKPSLTPELLTGYKDMKPKKNLFVL